MSVNWTKQLQVLLANKEDNEFIDLGRTVQIKERIDTIFWIIPIYRTYKIETVNWSCYEIDGETVRTMRPSEEVIKELKETLWRM